jgi:hypothetical protein
MLFPQSFITPIAKERTGVLVSCITLHTGCIIVYRSLTRPEYPIRANLYPSGLTTVLVTWEMMLSGMAEKDQSSAREIRTALPILFRSICIGMN